MTSSQSMVPAPVVEFVRFVRFVKFVKFVESVVPSPCQSRTDRVPAPIRPPDTGSIRP